MRCVPSYMHMSHVAGVCPLLVPAVVRSCLSFERFGRLERMRPAFANKPTSASTPRGAADELRIRKIAEKFEDKAFKFAQQPVIGRPQSAAAPPMAPRAPRLSEEP